MPRRGIAKGIDKRGVSETMLNPPSRDLGMSRPSLFPRLQLDFTSQPLGVQTSERIQRARNLENFGFVSPRILRSAHRRQLDDSHSTSPEPPRYPLQRYTTTSWRETLHPAFLIRPSCELLSPHHHHASRPKRSDLTSALWLENINTACIAPSTPLGNVGATS